MGSPGANQKLNHSEFLPNIGAQGVYLYRLPFFTTLTLVGRPTSEAPTRSGKSSRDLGHRLPGPWASASLRSSAPRHRDIARSRALSACSRAISRLTELRASHGRPTYIV